MDWQLLINAILIPFLLFVANTSLRAWSNSQQSSAADVIIILIAFDLGFLVNQNVLTESVLLTLIKGFEPSAFAVLLMIGFLTWQFLVIKLEKPLVNYYTKKYSYTSSENQDIVFPFFQWIFSWTMAMVLMGTHLLIFTVKEL